MRHSTRYAVPLLAMFALASYAPTLIAQDQKGPSKITHVDPVYPELAKAARIQGSVIVQITVGTDGRVSNPRVLRSIPLLDQAAVDAVKQWVYDATTIKAPVTFSVTVPFGVAAPSTATEPTGPPASRPPAAPRPPVPVREPPGSPSRPTTPSTAADPAPASSGLGVSDFSVKGLNLETELTALYLGDFAHARLERVSVEFDALFASYLSAFARRCSAHLPATRVEITRSECAREQYPVNGFGMRVGPSTCIEYRDAGTGLYADPNLYAAQQRVDAQVARNMVGDTLRGMAGNNPMGTAMRTMDAVTSVGGDMDSLIEMNTCTSAALERFEQNMRRFALGEPPLRLAGGETLASVRPKPSPGAFKDSDYTRLLDDLIAENSQGWMVNRYVQGSVSDVAVTSRDALGRPAMITGNYLFDGLNGRSRGSVALHFADGLPACVYFSDFPDTCRAPSRRIITAYENGRYQR